MIGLNANLHYSTTTGWRTLSNHEIPQKKENFIQLFLQTLESPPLKKRKIEALSTSGYELSFNNYLDFNPHLWHPEQIYSLTEVLAIVMGDSSDFQLLMDLVSSAEDGISDVSGKFLSLLLKNLKAYEEKLIKKSVDVTHQEVICFYILRHACEKRFGSECGKRIADFNQSLLPNLISNLSIPEKGQLVRYANLIDYPNQEAANHFRALIGPHLYKLVRFGTEVYSEWISVRSILQHISDDIAKLIDPFQSDLRKNFVKNSVLKNTEAAIFSSVREVCLKLIDRIENGAEVQLPKFAHSIGKKTSKDGCVPTLFFTDDICEINSTEANMAGAFESTRIEETYQLPALMLTHENEWRKDKYLRNYFIPKQEGSRCTDFWLGWKKKIPISRRDINGAIKGSSIFGIVVEGHLVEEQKNRLLTHSRSLPHLADILVFSRSEALFFERRLKKFPLFLPLHLQEKTELNPNKKSKTEALKSPSLSPALSPTPQASLISIACRNSTPNLFLSKLAEGIKSRGRICIMCDDAGLIYSQEDVKKFPKNKSNLPFHLNMLMLFTISNPDITQKAIIQGVISPPLTARSYETTADLLAFERTRSELIKSVPSVFPGLQCELPPARRNVWPHQKNLSPYEIVGFNPLLSFNFIKIQTLLAKESMKLFFRHNSSKFEPQVFFKLLALQILSEAKNLGQVLQTHFTIDNREQYEVILDHNTFDTMDDEFGFNKRHCPNEPVFTHLLIQCTGDELIRSAILKPELEHSEKVKLTLHFLSEVAKGIEQRYFFKNINPERKLARKLDNRPLLAILNMLHADFQANDLDIDDYEGLIMKGSKQSYQERFQED